MKKILLFLMTIISLFGISIKTVNAKTTFYEAEKIDNIWTKSVKGSTAHFQKARFYRRTSDNKPAYCIEPFTFFKPEESYVEYLNPDNISKETWERITLIAHFGYGYANHQDNKWYAITQLMIWKEAAPDAQFYFTDKLNGNKIDIFIDEQQEIYKQVNQYQTKPNIDTEINIVENQYIEVYDTNNVLNNYQISNKIENIKIENNKLVITGLTKGIYNLTLTKNSVMDSELSVYYYNHISQDLMTAGNIESNCINIKINVEKTEINITKTDNITKTTIPSGEAKLEGTIFGLFDLNNNLIKKLIINKDGTTQVKNIPYGNYIIKELQAGTGYTLNQNKYEINLNKDNTEVNLKLENKVIEKKLIIHKEYSNTINSYPEANITFLIYNKANQLINKITTDTNGNAKINLPFGTYKIIQENTTDGYNKVDPFTVTINESNENELSYNLTDYKIKVPNTYSNKKENPLKKILYILIKILRNANKKFFI